MSGSVGDPPVVSDPLVDSELVDARRFCGYPAFGTGTSSDPFFRFSKTYVELEFHLFNLTDPELIVCRAKLSELTILDTAIPGAGQNLDTDVAAVWQHNKQEVVDRTNLFNMRRRAFCDFLGVPPGPSLRGAGNSISFIV